MPRKLIALVGATASGKTSLAIDIAKYLPAQLEAINADSRQVYRRMDIGTAKPTSKERAALMHRLVDVVNPDQPFGLVNWLDLANEALESCWSRGVVPIVVGGTGQYVWALLEGWRVPEVPAQEEWRREMEARTPAELLAELRRIDPESNAYIQPQNVRRIVRAIEVYNATGRPFSHWRTKEPPSFEWLAIANNVPREALYARIDARVDAMMEAGFVDEVKMLREMGYSRDQPSMSSIGYTDIAAHLDGEMTLDEAVVRTKNGTHRLARHQNSWFKPTDARIRWLDAPSDACAIVSQFLERPDA
ncbi:MAG: tRNA (adenosine(37)-N6)-dimethylallyltransferase MiaA [Chloroflexota bacterium]